MTHEPWLMEVPSWNKIKIYCWFAEPAQKAESDFTVYTLHCFGWDLKELFLLQAGNCAKLPPGKGSSALQRTNHHN
jgi:hypothetical protein